MLKEKHNIQFLNGATLLVLYIQDDRYFGSLYGLETHDKRKKARAKADVFPSKRLLHLWGEPNLLKISSIKAFFHIPLLHSKHPVNNILQELINHTHKKKNSLFLHFLKFYCSLMDLTRRLCISSAL